MPRPEIQEAIKEDVLLNAIIDPEGAQMGQMITALNSPLWKWTILNIFLQNLAMRLQLLRPHSADHYYYSGLAFFRNFNKKYQIGSSTFLTETLGALGPKLFAAYVCQDNSVVKPLFPRIFLRTKHPVRKRVKSVKAL